MNLEKLKYPIGKREFDPNKADQAISTWIKSIEEMPDKLIAATSGLSEKQLTLNYRPGSWTIAQLVHHLADSHINAYVRFKFALTEDHPKVKGYDENDWALTIDAQNINIKPSLNIISGIHARWAEAAHNMKPADLQRKYHHLGYKNDWTQLSMLNLYAWHSEHHLAHVHQAIKLNGNFE